MIIVGWTWTHVYAGNREDVGKAGIHTKNGVSNGPTIRGFSEPSTQGGGKDEVQWPMGSASPMAEPFRSQIKDLRFRQGRIQGHSRK